MAIAGTCGLYKTSDRTTKVDRFRGVSTAKLLDKSNFSDISQRGCQATAKGSGRRLGNGDARSAVRLFCRFKAFNLRMMLEIFLYAAPQFAGAVSVN